MTIYTKINRNFKSVVAHIYTNLFPSKYMVIKAQVEKKRNRIIHFNWGDDMNYYLLSIIGKKKVYPIKDSKIQLLFPVKSYLAIGSTISFYSLDKVTIWGAGIINQNEIGKIRGKPEKICAVRGPLTRKALIKKGYNCPEVYGDPVLLLPRYYSPKIKAKKYKIGIIPHYIDKQTRIIETISDDSIKIIDIQNYNRWQDFVDEICECQYICSSSLHGLICSEAYGIPSIWIGLSQYPAGWEFKFYDFYYSIGKRDARITRINSVDDLLSENTMSKLSKWSKGIIDLNKLLDACPFKSD